MILMLGQVVVWVELPVQKRSARFSRVVSGYPTSTNIPQVDGLLTDTPGLGASQLGIKAKVNDYPWSSVGVSISLILIPASQLDIRA